MYNMLQVDLLQFSTKIPIASSYNNDNDYDNNY